MKTFFLLFTLLLTTAAFAQETEEIVSFPDVEAHFPGGTEVFSRYINEQIQYPSKAMKKGITGRVYISFVVRKDGTISNVRVVRGVHPLLDEEAVRVVSNMPNWKPGEKNGEKVSTKCLLPLVFNITKRESRRAKRRAGRNN